MVNLDQVRRLRDGRRLLDGVIDVALINPAADGVCLRRLNHVVSVLMEVQEELKTQVRFRDEL